MGQSHRGVFTLPFLNDEGQIVMVAVSSRRRCIGATPIAEGVDPATAEANLYALLDMRDPVPNLSIVHAS